MRINRLLICGLVSFFAFCNNSFAQVKIIQTIAGTNTAGYNGDNLPATTRNLNAPYGYALDPTTMNLYIADQANNRIRVVNLTTNVITTLGGNGVASYGGDGSVVTAGTVRFSGPTNVAFDATGNLFIADAGNNCIRKVAAGTLILSTIAGKPLSPAGYSGDGGQATDAQLNNPRGICFDPAGNLYISDPGPTFPTAGYNHIRKVDMSTGVITTIAGNGTTGGYGGDGGLGTSARLNNPRGLICDATGANLYIADMTNNRIRILNLGTGIINTFAGSGSGGFAGDGLLVSAPAVQVNIPSGVALDNTGSLIIADAGNDRIRRVDVGTNIITTIAGASSTNGFAGDGGPATNAAVRMNGPASVAFTPWGEYYIFDRSNNRVRRVKNNSIPYFSSGTMHTINVCEGSTNNSINTILPAMDSDVNQTLTWSVVAPVGYTSHGTFGGFGTTSPANGTAVTPTGKTYTPNVGFYGTDTFIVSVSDAYNSSVDNDTVIVTVDPLPITGAISGSSSVCEGGATTTLSATATYASSGTSWSSSNTSVATVGASTGDVTGVSAGTATITFTGTNTCGSRYSTFTMTVLPLPNAGTITGPSNLCMSSTITLFDGSSGGIWSSANTGIATVSSTGDVSPVVSGSVMISYTVTNSCGTAATGYNVTVIDLPFAGSISGATTVCEGGSTIALTDATPGGVWTTANTTASVSGGVVTGLAAGANTVSYTFTNFCGSDVATYPITVLPLPNAGVISGFNSVCVTGMITLSDPVSGGVWGVTTGNASISGTGDVTGVTAGSDLISYSYTNSCGTDVSTYAINVVSSPSAGTITGTSSVCVGSSVTLSSDVVGGVWGTTTGKASITSGGLMSGVTGGTDLISYTVTLSCGSATSTYAVTVNPLADPGVITGSTVACIGASTKLTDATPGGVWSSSSTSIATVSGSGLVNGIAAGTATISYSATNICGTISALQTMTINAIVTPFVSVTASTGFTSCSGSTVMYTPIPINGGTTPTYVWKVNGSTVSSGSTFSYIPNNGDVVSVTMTSSYGCLTAPTASSSNTQTVNPTVVPTINISTGTFGDTVCTGTSTPFTAAITNGGTTPSYDWYVNGFYVGSGNPIFYTPIDGDMVSCTFTSSAACATPAAVTSNTVTMTVDPAFSEMPKIDIMASPGSSVCNLTPVKFIANWLYGGPTPFLRWTKNGVNVATGPTYTYVPANGDIVHCMLLSSSTCLISSSFDSVFSSDITVSVLTELAPHVSITSSPGNTVGKNESATFTAKVSNPTITMTYQWYVNGVAIPGETNKTFVYSQTDAGTTIINCVVNSGDVCNTTSISNLINLTVSDLAVHQVNAYGNAITLVPNPNKGTFTVQGAFSADSKEATLEVVDVLGQVVYRDAATLQNGVLNKVVSVSNELANGTYMLRVISGEENSVARFTINK